MTQKECLLDTQSCTWANDLSIFYYQHHWYNKMNINAIYLSISTTFTFIARRVIWFFVVVFVLGFRVRDTPVFLKDVMLRIASPPKWKVPSPDLLFMSYIWVIAHYSKTTSLQPTSAFLLFSLKFSSSTITTTIYVASLECVLSLGKLQAFTNFQ